MRLELFHAIPGALALALALAGGCRTTSPLAERPDAGAPFDGAVSDAGSTGSLVPRIGSDDALDIATWNVENFPQRASTPRQLAELITSLDLDLVAIQEVTDIDAFDELLTALPKYDAVLSPHTYSSGEFQKLALVYRRDLIRVDADSLLFEGDTYAFPRPPLRVELTIDDGRHPVVDLIAIVLHLKAGFGISNEDRREAAIQRLEEHVRESVDGAGDDDVLLLGDFNEVLTTSGGRERFSPFLATPDRYSVHTRELADEGDATFVPSGVILDHVISTASLADEFAGGTDAIPRLDIQFTPYSSSVSDHLPVVVSMPIFR